MHITASKLTTMDDLFHRLHTLIHNSSGSKIHMHKSTLATVVTYLQNLHNKVDLLINQKKLLSTELSLFRSQHSNAPDDIKHLSFMNESKTFDKDASYEHNKLVDEPQQNIEHEEIKDDVTDQIDSPVMMNAHFRAPFAHKVKIV